MFWSWMVIYRNWILIFDYDLVDRITGFILITHTFFYSNVPKGCEIFIPLGFFHGCSIIQTCSKNFIFVLPLNLTKNLKWQVVRILTSILNDLNYINMLGSFYQKLCSTRVVCSSCIISFCITLKFVRFAWLHFSIADTLQNAHVRSLSVTSV